MSYRISPGGRPAADIPALMAEQAEKAVASLLLADDNPAEAVSAARRRFKKIRGALRLVRSASPHFYVQENARYRDLARALASLRDATAHVETLDGLTGLYAELLAPHAFVGIRQFLAQKAGSIVRQQEQSDLIEMVIFETRIGISALENLALPEDADELADILKKGVKKVYADARDGFEDIHDRPGSESFHEFRKSVKYHWMHVRLLQDIWPEPMLARRTEAKALSNALGSLNDIFVLRDALRSEDLPESSARELDLLMTLLARRQMVLTDQAMTMAGHLFTEKPNAYANRIVEHFTQAVSDANAVDAILPETLPVELD